MNMRNFNHFIFVISSLLLIVSIVGLSTILYISEGKYILVGGLTILVLAALPCYFMFKEVKSDWGEREMQRWPKHPIFTANYMSSHSHAFFTVAGMFTIIFISFTMLMMILGAFD